MSLKSSQNSARDDGQKNNVASRCHDDKKTLSQKLSIVKEDTVSSSWYKDGLRFMCTGCGRCCTGFSGAVWVSDEELADIAAVLHESLDEVQQKYTRLIGENERRSLKEVGPDYDCVFLDNKKLCRVYEARPKQCRTYPWWPALLENRTTWDEAKSMCEGIEHPDAPLIARCTIEEIANS